MLSQAAFNAFLKTLEEPPAHAIFILATTEKHKVLPTILSRCQTYDFSRISVPDIERNLRDVAKKEKVKIDEMSLHVIAVKADGAMRDALTIFDQTVAFCGTDIKYEDVIRNLNVLDYEYGFSMVDYFLAGDYKSALLSFNDVLSKGFNALHFIGEISNHLRNLIVSRSGGMEALLELPDSLKQKFAEQASRCSLKFLYDALGISIQCESGYKASSNPRLHIEFALMRMAFLVRTPDATPAPAPSVAAPVSAPAPAVAPAPVAAPAPAPAPAAAPVATPAAAPAAAASAAKPVGEPVEPAPAPSPTPATVPAPDSAPAAAPSVIPTEAQRAEGEDPLPAAPRRRRAAKTGASLSLGAILDEKEESADAVEIDTAGQVIPSDESVAAAFGTLAEQYSGQTRLYNMLKAPVLRFAEEGGLKVVTLVVINDAQRKWIEERLLREMEHNLRRILSTALVKVLVDVTPDSEIEKKPYMPGEQALDLISKNEEVRKLVELMKLDTK
jgi:DNA polymerase-3 subunit gamma/tau